MRIMRVRIFEMGHSFEEIDNMTMQDYCDVLGYLEGESKVNGGGGKKTKNALKGKR